MKRSLLACAMAVALGGGALAQSATNNSTQSATTNNAQSASATTSTTTTNKVGLAKPPPGTVAPSTKKPRVNTNTLTNTPLTPQIAIQPGPTVGSPVRVNGPGGTTTNPTGN